MRGSLKYWLLLASCIVFAFILSYLAFFSFTFAVRLFHSVPIARACGNAGLVILYPAHIVFTRFGGLFDQSTPDSDPMNYMLINAALLGGIFYACLRPIVFRDKKSGK